MTDNQHTNDAMRGCRTARLKTALHDYGGSGCRTARLETALHDCDTRGNAGGERGCRTARLVTALHDCDKRENVDKGRSMARHGLSKVPVASYSVETVKSRWTANSETT